MVTHQNPSIVERASRLLNTKMGESLPDDVSGPVAVIPISPIVRFAETGVRSTSGSANIQGAFNGKDYYITGLTFSIVKDSTCDTADGSCTVTAVVDGLQKSIACLPLLTLTAQSMVLSISFPFPIRVDRGNVIAFGSNTFTVGKFIRAATIYGYTEEVARPQ